MVNSCPWLWVPEFLDAQPGFLTLILSSAEHLELQLKVVPEKPYVWPPKTWGTKIEAYTFENFGP